MSRFTSFPVSLFVLLTLGCAAEAPKADPAADQAAVRQAVEAANAKFMAALQAGDTVGVFAN